jgi:hypothetical protein
MIGVIQPETDCEDCPCDSDAQTNHHHLHYRVCAGRERKAHCGKKQSGAERGKQLDISYSPYFGDMLDVPEYILFFPGLYGSDCRRSARLSALARIL